MKDPQAPLARGRLWYWQPAVVALAGLVLTLLAWALLERQADRQARQRFHEMGQELAETLTVRLASYEQILRGGVALIDAQAERGATPDRQAWSTYVAGLRVEDHYPGILGIGYSPRVPRDGIALHEAAVRAEGFPAYAVSPRSTLPDAYPIVFLEPFTGRNLRAFGFDMFSEPERRAAMERARDSAVPAATGRVRLVQEDGHDVQAGFLIYLPVYTYGMPADTAAERRRAIRGFVYSPFRMGDLMRAILGPPFAGALDVALYDGIDPPSRRLLYASDGAERAPQEAEGHFTGQMALSVFGRSWLLDIATTAAFEGETNRTTALVVLAAGLVITGLMVIITGSLLAERRRAAALRCSYNALARARTEALHANAAKTRFLAAASHDLRQPMQTLGIYLHLLGSQPGADGMSALMTAANEAFDTAQRMLNSIMDIAALELGVAQPQEEMVALAPLLTRIGTDTAAEAAIKGLDVRMKLADLSVRTDPAMLDRVVRNLMQNAVKYTVSGVILLACRPARGGVVIKVQDTGPGIPPDRQHLIFEDFYQVGNPERDRSKGLGLGLSIVSRLSRLLGYRLGLLSRSGHGAVFTITIPHRPSLHGPAGPGTEGKGEGERM
ncbi:signal transduction histidine kinase [Azospirillum fermentarium]|uniref:CHASE domain-containing protein n=1 Tax=Azospirillum fermentarium TaxID=1233114 RepID=UPI0022268B58|nr:CHASE domain-containing protein [Azospirillum fermentarium]MCW2247275.1 signal transduction histidine kinase [Azospirillum fermentarium]